jgi:hypothetical protein
VAFAKNWLSAVRVGSGPTKGGDGEHTWLRRAHDQTAWMQAWLKLDQLRDDSVIVGWINMIAINLHRRVGQREARYQPLPKLSCAASLELSRLRWM